MSIRIGFTGHRDKYADRLDLYRIHEEYPDAVWVCGGAKGFDTQVKDFGELYGHTMIIILPKYNLYPNYPKIAPLKRNEEIVKMSDVMVALWDGRKDGGTIYTIRYAKSKGKEIKFLLCYP